MGLSHSCSTFSPAGISPKVMRHIKRCALHTFTPLLELPGLKFPYRWACPRHTQHLSVLNTFDQNISTIR